MFLTVLVRIALLPVDPIPQPYVHDEFSYIFGGETLASGRLTTPTHPMWRFFETYHINMQPTYASKFQPGQAAFLAMGIVLFGHPWYGVLISTALMCGSICWMLQGWMPPKYALLGGLFAFLQFGVLHYWMDSYWGGSVAGIGGALVFGALPRLARDGRVSAAFAAAIGTAILANSRPFEGLVAVLLSCAAFLVWTRRRTAVWLRPAPILACGVVLLITAGAMAYYNFRVTGSALTLSYTVNNRRYLVAPVFWVLPPYPPTNRQYRDPSMQRFREGWESVTYSHVRHNPAIIVHHFYDAISGLIGSGAGIVLLFLSVCAIPLAGIARMRLALGVLVLFMCAIAVNRFTQAHYLAPVVGVFFVIAMTGLQLLRSVRLQDRKIGRALAASIVGLAFVLFALNTASWVVNHAGSVDTSPTGFRVQVAAKLGATPGNHLVLVHYSPTHDPFQEVVYNSPDIDAQKIVWAFDFGPEADRPLLNYYRDRKVWLVQPDGPQPTLEPYQVR